MPDHAITADSLLLRPLEPRDHAAVLAVNATCQPEVAPLELADLTGLLARYGRHSVAVDLRRGRVIGYLLTFDSEETGYNDEEIHAFRTAVARPFVYVAQIALAAEFRRVGLGRVLYESVFSAARTRGRPRLCADVNLRPPNDASLRFHARLGFRSIGEMETSIGYRVALLSAATPPPATPPSR